LRTGRLSSADYDNNKLTAACNSFYLHDAVQQLCPGDQVPATAGPGGQHCQVVVRVVEN